MGFLESLSNQQQVYPMVNSILPDIAKKEIENGRLPRIKTDNIFFNLNYS